MQVVNDPAERAVKDIQDFVMLTQDKEHRDNIIMVAREQRKKFAKCRKLDMNWQKWNVTDITCLLKSHLFRDLFLIK